MIGLCINHYFENYGGILQAYATVWLLEERGIDYWLIRYEKDKGFAFLLQSIPRLFNPVLVNDKLEAAKKKLGLLRNPEFARQEAIRKGAFRRFRAEHFIKLSAVYQGYKALCEGTQDYDAFITGSDQLWSPAGLPTNYYTLVFVPDGIRKISLASSFGVAKIPWYQKKRTARYLRRIDHISMRENRGAEIVRELTGRSVPTVLDPVFMPDAEAWRRLIPEEKRIQEPYLLAYLLGNSAENRACVQRAAQTLGCKIVTFRHLDQYAKAAEQFGDYAPYDADPAMFLNLLRGAEYVCTDSYHGTVLSVIHEKKFVTFDRYSSRSIVSKNSRIDTLTQNLQLKQRRYRSMEALASQLTAEIDYAGVNDRLKRLRAETAEYLDQSLKGLHGEVNACCQ